MHPQRYCMADDARDIGVVDPPVVVGVVAPVRRLHRRQLPRQRQGVDDVEFCDGRRLADRTLLSPQQSRRHAEHQAGGDCPGLHPASEHLAPHPRRILLRRPEDPPLDLR